MLIPPPPFNVRNPVAPLWMTKASDPEPPVRLVMPLKETRAGKALLDRVPELAEAPRSVQVLMPVVSGPTSVSEPPLPATTIELTP